MADGQKLIGVCLSQAHSSLNTGFLTELGRVAGAEGYSIVVFNSSLDFYWYQKDNPVPRAVYRAIPHERFDAIIIIYHSFHDDALANEIIAGAQAHHVPVICAGAQIPGCFSILNSYEDSFKFLIRHVIRDHGVKDTFFIAGMKNETNSEDRLRCYREVLEEEGLPFSEDLYAYGNYWARPAANIVGRLIRTREKMPGAIFCANDTMAISVCDTLKKNGYRVPDDVIVTGFDGIPAAYMTRPHLTTCSDDPHTLAEQILELMRAVRSGEEPEPTLIHHFRPVLAGSCGCPGKGDDRYDALTVYQRSEALNTHENDLYHKVERMLIQRDSDSFMKMISASILPRSFICLNRRYLDIYTGVDYKSDRIEEELMLIPFRERDEELAARACTFRDYQTLVREEPGIIIYNPIHTGSDVCGFFCAYTTDLESDTQLIKRLSDVLNLVFTIQLGNARQQLLIHHLNDTLYLDSATGLSNLRGLTRWFDHYSAQEDSRRRALALSVYSIYRYNYIYENYGMDETEELVRLVSNRLLSSNPSALVIARISEDQFVVVDSGDDPESIGRIISRTTDAFFRQIESYNSVSSRQYYVEVNCGCTTLNPGWKNATLENLIRLAVGELYLNRMRSVRRPAVKPTVSTAELYSAFNLLMEKNLFKFHFQPIVDAKTAQIYAYEALMRTDYLINLSPLEILATAREYNRLYDVERTTFFGIMERFVQDFGEFNGNKVFINTIPGYFLSEEDCAAVREQFESYLDCFVFELTEQGSTTEEELNRLRSLCKPGGIARIAIDDYGAGHSNIVNVLRYTPQIIKIDRALISGINTDSNKQLFVRNTIDFAHQNGIRALAEGVETADELRSVIDCGIDYIQGFYTGRPTEHPVPSINESVRHEILAENLLLARFEGDAQVYTPRDDETVNVLDLALHQYTCLHVAEGHVTLTGHEKQSVDMVIRVAENTETVITLDHVNLKGVNEPVIQLGERSRVTLELKGSCVLNKDGIRVPPTASLTLCGTGDLRIQNSRNYSIGIGSNYNDPYGTIVVDMEGSLSIQSSGDKVVCIGGGRSMGGGISILRGSCRLSANGISTVGIGSSTGDARIDIRSGASVTARLEGNDALGIGSLSGEASICSAGQLELTVDSERATGIGSINGRGEIRLEGGFVLVITHCDAGACIGTFSGEVSSRIGGTQVRIHGEGNRVAGFGSPDGACDTLIDSGDIQGDILAGESLLLGNDYSRVIITGGNIRLFPDSRHNPLGPGDVPLRYFAPNEDHFEQTFTNRHSTWTYVADRNAEGQLGVWIPAE